MTPATQKLAEDDAFTKWFHANYAALMEKYGDQQDEPPYKVYKEVYIFAQAAWDAALAQEQDGWIDVRERLPPLDADNCCMEDEERGRFSDLVIVFDEDEVAITSAVYDGQKDEWSDARNGGQMFGITHWRPLPTPPGAQVAALPERPKA